MSFDHDKVGKTTLTAPSSAPLPAPGKTTLTASALPLTTTGAQASNLGDAGDRGVRGDGGDFESDWAGLEILRRYLDGGGDWAIVDDPKWTAYMKANENLRQQLYGRIMGLVYDYKQHSEKSITMYQSFHAVLETGEGIVGYQYLHGTNSLVGDFKLYGKANVHEGVVELDANFQWNDIIDPNMRYATDSLKDDIAWAMSLGRRSAYRICIKWSEKIKVRFDANGRLEEKTGYPFDL